MEEKERLTEEQVDKALDAAIDIIYDDLAVEVDREEMDVPVIEYLRGVVAGLEQLRKERKEEPMEKYAHAEKNQPMCPALGITQIDALLTEVNAKREFDTDPNSLTKTRCSGCESIGNVMEKLSDEEKLEALQAARGFLGDDLEDELVYRDGEAAATTTHLQNTIMALERIIQELNRK